MPVTESLEHTAWMMIEREWSRSPFNDAPDHLAHYQGPGLCPVSWLLRDLLVMLSENHDRPVRELESAIRKLITEQCFAGANGDVCIEEQQQQQIIDEQVELFVRVLERVRHVAFARGEWSDLPTTPLMFG